MDSELHKNQEITDALKTFEEKFNLEQEVMQEHILVSSDETPKMVKILMKLSGGAINRRKQGEYLLLVFVVVSILIILIIMLRFNVTKLRPSVPSIDGIYHNKS